METEEDELSDFIPRLGHTVEGDACVIITEAVKKRLAKFPDEPIEQALPLILMNIGSRFQPLRCEAGEWQGLKKDVVMPEEGDPTCPNGHALIKERGLTLGWVIDRA